MYLFFHALYNYKYLNWWKPQLHVEQWVAGNKTNSAWKYKKKLKFKGAPLLQKVVFQHKAIRQFVYGQLFSSIQTATDQFSKQGKNNNTKNKHFKKVYLECKEYKLLYFLD